MSSVFAIEQLLSDFRFSGFLAAAAEFSRTLISQFFANFSLLRLNTFFMNWLFCAKIRRRAFREKSENPRKNLQFCKKAVILYSMDNENSYAVGIDIGTDAVKVVIGRVDSSEDSVENSREISVIGVGVQKNLGMRKGVVTNLDKTAEAIDRALNSAERMSGAHVDRATVSINGSHISGLASSGVVAVMNNKPIDAQDIARVRDAATVVAIPKSAVFKTVVVSAA